MKRHIIWISAVLVLSFILQPASHGFGENPQLTQRRVRITKLPDLEISISGPNHAIPGKSLGKSFQISVKNSGNAPAGPFFVDIILSSDKRIPAGLLTHSPTFQEDVLLKGGRIGVKKLDPGQSLSLNLSRVSLQPDIPIGKYIIAAVADARASVKEKSEINNRAFLTIAILARIESDRVDSIYPHLAGYFHISGLRFGTSQGSRVLKIGSHVVTNIHSWQNTHIKFDVPTGIVHAQNYTMAIYDGSNIVSNQYDYFLQMLLYSKSTGQWEGQAGSEIQVLGMGLVNTQGTKNLMFGSTIATVVSWDSNDIHFIIPNLPPGNYPIKIQDGSQVVSTTTTVQIIP